MTVIAATSDFHGKFPRSFEIPTCDILVVAGDFGASAAEVDAWLSTLPHWPGMEVVAVSGNADYGLHKEAWRLPWTYLEDEGAVIMGIPFYGAVGNNINEDWSALGIPGDTVVMVTHWPPRGILDEVLPGEHIGSPVVREEVMGSNVILHLFGHCHEQAGRTHQEEGTTFANCGYLGRNAPLVFEI